MAKARLEFSLTEEQRGPTLVLFLKGYLNEVGGEALRQRLDALEQTDTRCLVLDFSQCLHVNSQGISCLVEVADRLTDEKQLCICFCRLAPLVAESFRMVGLTRLGRIFATLEDALKGIAE